MTTPATTTPAVDPTLTAAQQQVFQSQVAKINAQMNTAWTQVQSTASNSTIFKVATSTGLYTKNSGVGIAQQQLTQAQTDLGTATAQGTAVLNISTVPLSQDAGRARLTDAVNQYKKMATSFIAECQTVVKSITDTTAVATLTGILTTTTSVLADGITAMLNAIAAGLVNLAIKTATGLSLSSILLIGGLVYVAFFTKVGKALIL